MPWTYLSDDFADQCWSLSDAAFRTHVEGLIWSNRGLLDCQIPPEDFRRALKCEHAVDELVAAGWWQRLGDDFVIVHNARFQRTREQVLAKQAVSRENGAKSAGRPKVPRQPALAGETHVGTQLGTHVGTQPGTHVETQPETQRERKGQDPKGSMKGPPTEAPFDKWTHACAGPGRCHTTGCEAAA